MPSGGSTAIVLSFSQGPSQRGNARVGEEEIKVGEEIRGFSSSGRGL